MSRIGARGRLRPLRWIACGALVLAIGCSSDSDDGDVTGPFSGDVRRYDVDKLILPSTTALQNQYAGDLDGDGSTENQLGLIVAALTQTNDTNKHVPDMIASRALASYLELHADGLDSDGSVGVRYFADAMSMSDEVGGKITGGAYTSNRTATTKHVARGEVALPVFADADPLVVPLVGVEIDLAPDGSGGFDGIVRGGIPIDDARTVAYAGVLQMMKTNPTAHLPFARLLDTNHDGVIAQAELASNGVLTGFLVDDIAIGDARVLSAAFGIHVCAHGACADPTPANPCADRIKDGAETDIDCGGGTCPACAAQLACSTPADCQTGGCEGATCRAPTCTDGFRDGFESDVDCGAACGTCTTGQKCATGDDCTSTRCNAGTGSTGTCAP